MTSNGHVSAQRVRGLLLGAAVGDALGWPQEDRSNIVGGAKARRVEPRAQFRAWERNSGTQYTRYQERIEAGTYSDDTQLLLAVARTCLRRSHWWDALTRIELPQWTLYQRGGGRAVLGAARAWAAGHAPWLPGRQKSRDPRATYFGAGSNGVVMRVAPHAVITLDDDAPTELLARVIKDGLATHGHARALVGAGAYALALRHALRLNGTLGYGDLIQALLDDKSWRAQELLERHADEAWSQHRAEVGVKEPVATEWQQAATEMEDLLVVARGALDEGAMARDEKTLDALGCFGKTRGAGTITAAAAIYLASRSASRPQSGLLRAAFLDKADTDTLAATTATLLGALHGTDWLGPLAVQVQDHSYMESLAERLVMPDREADDNTTPEKVQRLSERGLREWRDSAFGGKATPALPDGRLISDRTFTLVASLPSQRVERITVTVEDRQTLVIDRTVKGPPAATQDSLLAIETADDMTAEPTGAPGGEARSRLVSISLRVASTERAAEFYRDLLGLSCRAGRDGVLVIADNLVLIPRREKATRDRDVLVSVEVADLDQVAARVQESAPEAQLKRTGIELRLVDPDGYDVRVIARHSR